MEEAQGCLLSRSNFRWLGIVARWFAQHKTGSVQTFDTSHNPPIYLVIALT